MTSTATESAWKSARSLADLGELTARWLEGDLPETPCYCGPPDDETLPLVPVLAALNRAGYVTTFSQPGETGPGLDCELWEQRAAVDGFASLAVAQRIYEDATDAGLTVIAYDPATLPRRRFRWTWAEPVTLCDGEPCTWAGAQVPRRELRDPETGYGACQRTAVAAVCHAWQVSVIDPEWGRNDLLWEVLSDA